MRALSQRLMPDPVVPPKEDQPQITPEGKPAEDHLPEKFRGKSHEELVKMFEETEKKLTHTAQDAAATKKQLADLKALETFIDNDPESIAFLKQRIQNSKRQTPAQDKTAIDPRYDQIQAELVDTKLAAQGQIFEKFEGKYGLNDKGAEKDIKHKIGEAIKTMVAPKSSKSATEIIAGLPLDLLPMYLENAYKLVTMEDEKEQTRRKALANARQNADATFSSHSSSSLSRNSTTLTAEEKKVAKGLGISEEKYLKQKQAYASEYIEE